MLSAMSQKWDEKKNNTYYIHLERDCLTSQKKYYENKIYQLQHADEFKEEKK